MFGDNVITLIGEVSADPVLRRTRTGSPVCNFTVTALRSRRDRDTGEWQPDIPLMVRCVLWHGQAENLVASVREGDRLIVQGRLRPRSITSIDGVTRTVLELEVDECGPSLREATAVPAPAPSGEEGSE